LFGLVCELAVKNGSVPSYWLEIWGTEVWGPLMVRLVPFVGKIISHRLLGAGVKVMFEARSRGEISEESNFSKCLAPN